jgi:hypothetical protein
MCRVLRCGFRGSDGGLGGFYLGVSGGFVAPQRIESRVSGCHTSRIDKIVKLR